MRLIYPGMCWCLKVSAVKGFDFKEKNRKGHPSYKDLVDNIPEFNPEFLKAIISILKSGLLIYFLIKLKDLEIKWLDKLLSLK